jgi:hypothetical protein
MDASPLLRTAPSVEEPLEYFLQGVLDMCVRAEGPELNSVDIVLFLDLASDIGTLRMSYNTALTAGAETVVLRVHMLIDNEENAPRTWGAAGVLFFRLEYAVGSARAPLEGQRRHGHSVTIWFHSSRQSC